MRRWLLVALLGCALIASRIHAEDVSKVTEASMTVTGIIELSTDGSVRSYTIEKQEKLPRPVIDLIQKNVPTWKFEFANVRTSSVKQAVSLRIVARDVDSQRSTVSIAGAQFDDIDESGDSGIQWTRRPPPVRYPDLAGKAGMSGTVYLLLRVGRDGKVTDVAAEQVNLRRYTSDSTMMKRYREDLATAAIKAAKRWTFRVPTKGESAQDPYWLVRTSVNFLGNDYGIGTDRYSGVEYGTWEIYIRGPRQSVPWLEDNSLLSEAPDTTPDGVIHQLGVSVRLSGHPSST